MANPTASIDNPETWHLFAQLDREFLQLVDGGTGSSLENEEMIPCLAEFRSRRNRVFREKADNLLEETNGEVTEKEIFIPVRDGSTVRALVYRSKCGATKNMPLFVIVHGGGFRIGNAELESKACIGATQRYGCVSVSLEHRLSPEFKFPVAFEDCWDALLWLAKNANTIGADPLEGFVFGGTSSGAHIANALVHRARDENLQPPITGVYLNAAPTLAPQAMTDEYRDLSKSREALKDGHTLNSKSIELYDHEIQPDFSSPLWSPLLWPTGHGDLPPTFFQICGADLLRDDSLIYEREMRVRNGLKTKAIVYQGLPHVFWYTHPSLSASKRFEEDTILGVGWLFGDK
ncbi:Alpha/beta hydrolase fold-3 [Penicillium expansum]|nr:Alpha/beta hydrolase fold-3 [Penicillium expansum]KGO65819.1 Alpha/beta hydrolase fold-3 [Penicillium expansum]